MKGFFFFGFSKGKAFETERFPSSVADEGKSRIKQVEIFYAKFDKKRVYILIC